MGEAEKVELCRRLWRHSPVIDAVPGRVTGAVNEVNQDDRPVGWPDCQLICFE